MRILLRTCINTLARELIRFQETSPTMNFVWEVGG